VFFVDLDAFKAVNDGFGHLAGDALLRGVATRMAAVCSGEPGTELARVGGDEFVVLCSSADTEEQAAALGERLRLAAAAPVAVADRTLRVTASVGCRVLTPEDAGRTDRLLADADLAMYTGKAAGRDTTVVFTARMREEAQRRALVEQELRLALDRDELRVVYQPQVDLRSGRVCGAEALLRWTSPALGVVPPGEFVPIAEHARLIGEIGRRVLERACAQLAEWGAAGEPAPPTVSVNVSAVQLTQPDFVEEVAALLEAHGVPASRLELELTETALLDDPEAAAGVLRRLASLGLHIGVDDFGVGQSSLSLLRRLPVDVLKVDRAFVADLAEDPRPPVVLSVLGLAQALDLHVVAEGVESELQRERLLALGCSVAQGFLFAPGVDAAALSTLCARGFPAASGARGPRSGQDGRGGGRRRPGALPVPERARRLFGQEVMLQIGIPEELT